MDVLVIGGGAREHALTWKLMLSPLVDRVYVAPGNGGLALLAVTAPFDPKEEDTINVLANWVMQRDIAFTIVGPEVPLANGIVDIFTAVGQPIVGPSQAAARIESSKDWAKQFMLRHHIPTAAAVTFDEFEPLREHLLDPDTAYPLVIKEDGLMAGKGVSVAQSRAEAAVWLARVAGTTVDRILAADFVANVAFNPTPDAVAAELPAEHSEPLDGATPQLNEADEDILVEAIARGLTAEQVAAIMRGESLSREQMLRNVPAPAPDEATTETDESELLPAADYARIRHERREMFKRAGRKVLVEEMLIGPEVSILAFTDGKTVKMMPPVCDYKRLGDGDSGPMTGGMGAYSPTNLIDAATLDWVREHIIEAAVQGMAEEGEPYKGVLYAGLMLTADGPKVLEFNARFGDPEAQVLMMLLDSDLAEICQAIIEERLAEQEIRWSSDACCAVVLAAPGYPDAPQTGQLIYGLDDIEEGVRVFHAGTTGSKALTDMGRAAAGGELVKRKKINWRTFLGRIDVPDFVTPNDSAAVRALNAAGGVEIRTAGGRVLTVTAKAPTLAEARAIAYRNAALISFPGQQMRTDIAQREIPADQSAPPPADISPTAATEPPPAEPPTAAQPTAPAEAAPAAVALEAPPVETEAVHTPAISPEITAPSNVEPVADDPNLQSALYNLPSGALGLSDEERAARLAALDAATNPPSSDEESSEPASNQSSESPPPADEQKPPPAGEVGGGGGEPL